MEGPALKRPKLQLGEVRREDWQRWSENLEILQNKLLSGCLCSVEALELQRPILPLSVEEALKSKKFDGKFVQEYTLQFVSTINLLIDTALKQQSSGFICKKMMDMASGVAMDEGIWEMLIEYLDSSDKFITLATSKGLVSMLMWTKLPNLGEIFDELFKSVMITTNNPWKLSYILEIIRGVVEYKDEDDHPLDLEDSESQPNNNPISSVSSTLSCFKVEVDTEIESEVKTLCVKALENWWNRLLAKFQNMMASFSEVDEAPILTFLSLWLSIISVKSNLSVIDTKHYYMHLEAFVPLLNPNSPAVIWKKLIDVFNEILCYGSTLSLQDVPNDEPCDLAHFIIRCVKSQQFLPGMPYSRAFCGFGGSNIEPVDWEWESRQQESNDDSAQNSVPCSSRKLSVSNPSSSRQFRLQPAIPSSSKSHLLQTSRLSPSKGNSSTSLPHNTFLGSQTHNNVVPGPSSSIKNTGCNISAALPRLGESTKKITSTIFVGPSEDFVQLEEPLDEVSGDRPLLQKVVLLVLKSVAVTVKETRCDDSDSGNDNSDDSDASGSDTDTNEMIIIGKSIREVFKQLDTFVKSLQPFHPESPLGEWIVKLFADQDDALVEAMLCTLDTYTGFLGRIEAPDFHQTFNPVKSFVSFLNSVSYDKDILLDWLMGNETCFLLYLLQFLKYSYRNWSEFVTSCGRNFDETMGLLIRLRMGVGRLVEGSLFPYNINPVLRLLERCEELYETNGSNNS